jgi:hypothetical protein
MDLLTEFQKWLSGDTTNATNTTGNTGFKTMPLNNFDISSGVSSGGAAGYSLSSGLGALMNGQAEGKVPPVVRTGTDDPTMWQSITGYKDLKGNDIAGYGTTGLGLLSGAMNMWNSYQTNQLAKDQFAFQKDAFNKNLAASIKSYNNSLTNQANRMAARGDSAMHGMTAGEYVSKYGM